MSVLMDSDQRRKRKRSSKPFYSINSGLFSLKSLLLCLSFFVFLLFLSSDRTESFRPVISVNTFSLLSYSRSNSIIDYSVNNRNLFSRPLRIEDRVLFPDHVLLFLSEGVGVLSKEYDKLECVYHRNDFNRSPERYQHKGKVVVSMPLLSADVYNEYRFMVRCPVPPVNYSTAVDLRRRGDRTVRVNGAVRNDRAIKVWERVVYGAELDEETGTAVLFVKGLNLRSHRKSDPRQLSCRFAFGNREKGDKVLVLTTRAVSAAQEVVRCLLPRSIRSNPSKARGLRVTLGVASNLHTLGRSSVQVPMPSVARIYGSTTKEERRKSQKYEICACTMAWNQASSLREWIMYHAWLGVDRWFIYDNNSDDDTKEVIEKLDSEGYNVSRHSWPWIKTQEAGFSHCILRAREECQWVGFFDVDEFFYFQFPSRHHKWLPFPGQNSLRDMVANYSSSSEIIAEIRTDCHSFGPSGLTSPPSQGVTIGYTCRLQQPERHKSIVRPEAIDISLLNEVHHFRLREGFRYLNVPESTAVINHYKYQVWETFRTKFYRRVATYVADWQENQNQGSKDRAPGLGTEAIEPLNWRLQFCEVWDTGLRDFVLANFADPATGVLPWERSTRGQLMLDRYN